MTWILLLPLLLVIVGALVVRHVRAKQSAAEAAANARARAAARRSRVPAVSNNLKGVTASQTIEPVKPTRISLYDDEEDSPHGKKDERAA